MNFKAKYFGLGQGASDTFWGAFLFGGSDDKNCVCVHFFWGIGKEGV